MRISAFLGALVIGSGICSPARGQDVQPSCDDLRKAASAARIALRDCLSEGGGCKSDLRAVDAAMKALEARPDCAETAPASALPTPSPEPTQQRESSVSRPPQTSMPLRADEFSWLPTPGTLALSIGAPSPRISASVFLGRSAALGLGFQYSQQHVALLDQTGNTVDNQASAWLLTPSLRVYPATRKRVRFFIDGSVVVGEGRQDSGPIQTLAGIQLGAGLECFLVDHLSVAADEQVNFEHSWNSEATTFATSSSSLLGNVYF
jgi:hypothetical protein